uniref:Peroxisomal membrane protein 11C n=1 Tax=Heterorhabditis bacteriophora TaxID=37862 RepID=A0A1I7XNQ3_HETBA
MTTASINLDSLTRVLSTYSGRDKALRSLCFLLQLKAHSCHKGKTELLALAKQCSAARLVLRQFNHPSMVKTCQQFFYGTSTDKVEFACTATVTGIYTVYGVVELMAWLSDAKILAMDSARLWKLCLYMWITALVAGIIRQIRLISKKNLRKAQEEIITLVGLISDFVGAVHSLPHRILWAGKLSPSQSSLFFLIASLIGFYKVF